MLYRTLKLSTGHYHNILSAARCSRIGRQPINMASLKPSLYIGIHGKIIAVWRLCIRLIQVYNPRSVRCWILRTSTDEFEHVKMRRSQCIQLSLVGSRNSTRISRNTSRWSRGERNFHRIIRRSVRRKRIKRIRVAFELHGNRRVVYRRDCRLVQNLCISTSNSFPVRLNVHLSTIFDTT